MCVALISCWQLALEYGIKFMETSAKANINVENVSCSGVKFDKTMQLI